MPKLYKSYWLYAGLIPALTVLIDQWSKSAVLKRFHVPKDICEINSQPGLFENISPVVDLALVCNRGVSFGLLGGDSAAKRWALTLFAGFMCVVILYILSRTQDLISRFGLSLVLGGAIGNAIDRFFYGAVTDFISVGDLLPFFPWVFNVADSAITIGVILLLYANFFGEPARQNAKN